MRESELKIMSSRRIVNTLAGVSWLVESLTFISLFEGLPNPDPFKVKIIGEPEEFFPDVGATKGVNELMIGG